SSVTAVGMPDPYSGELPMAFVTLVAGSTCDSAELLAWCQGKISERAAIPKRIEIIDAMPLTAVGKIFRPALRQRITETILQEHLQRETIPAEVSTEVDKQKGMIARIRLQQPQQ